MGIMASDSRTLKLSILADVDDLKKKLGEADKAVETNANKLLTLERRLLLHVRSLLLLPLPMALN